MFFAQRHEEEGWGRQVHSPVNDAAGRTVAMKGRLAVSATSLWLCAKQKTQR